MFAYIFEMRACPIYPYVIYNAFVVSNKISDNYLVRYIAARGETYWQAKC